MLLPNEYKLKNLLQQWPDGTVATAHWLEGLGISKQLRFSYQQSGWIESIKAGAFKKTKDIVSWRGGVFAIQTQSNSFLHPGGLSALSMHGLLHYLRFTDEQIHLFVHAQDHIPKWFIDNNWGPSVNIYRTNFLPSELGLIDMEEKSFSIKVSSPERAILECLYCAPQDIDLLECYNIIEGLVNLQPLLLQELLEKCSSIKVVRLFLHMAEKAGHNWFKYINKSKLNIGSGTRSIVKNGVYVSSYKITVPRELGDL